MFLGIFFEVIHIKVPNIVKAARVHRTLTGISAVMVPVAFAGILSPEILIFCVCSVFLYAAAGIQNAKKDNDYVLPSYSKYVVFLLLAISLTVAASHRIVFLGIVGEFVLGIFYNFFSRYIFIADVTTLAMSHHTWPTFISSLLVGLDILTTLKLTFFMFFVFWFIIHLKNLKDTTDDRKRGYKTLTTELKNGRQLTIFFFELSYMLMVGGAFLFSLGSWYLAILGLLFLLKTLIVNNIHNLQEEKALNIMRLMVIVFLSGFIIEKAETTQLLVVSALPLLLYMVFVLKDLQLGSLLPEKPMLHTGTDTVQE